MGLIKNEFLTKKRYWASALTILLIVFVLCGVHGAQELTTPRYVTEEQSIELYSLEAGYEHSSIVKNENPLWQTGTVIDEQPFYFLTISPELDGTFYFRINQASPRDVTADYQLKRVLSCSGKGVVYWSKEEKITSGELSGNELQTEFQLNMTEIEGEIRAIRESLDFYGGDIKLEVITFVNYQGKIGDDKIQEERQFVLLIKPRGSYYEVSHEPLNETVKKQVMRQKAVALSSFEKATLILPPVILLVPIIGLAVIKKRYKPLTKERTEELKKEREYQKFKEQISLGKYPHGLKWSKQEISIESLKDLVEMAVDMDKRVIRDIEKETYFVIDGDDLYVYP